MKYDLIIGIDPAGIGNNGIVIYSAIAKDLEKKDKNKENK